MMVMFDVVYNYLNKIIKNFRNFQNNNHYTYYNCFQNAAYFNRISRILAVYMDLELKASVKGKEFLRTITNRIVLQLEGNLKEHPYDENNYILEAFVHMERILKTHKEIIDILFQ